MYDDYCLKNDENSMRNANYNVDLYDHDHCHCDSYYCYPSMSVYQPAIQNYAMSVLPYRCNDSSSVDQLKSFPIHDYSDVVRTYPFDDRCGLDQH